MALKYTTDDDGMITTPPKLYFARRATGKKDSNGYDLYKRICEPTIDEIVSLESNPKRPEDIIQDGVNDHAFDRTKYYLLGSLTPPALPADKTQKQIIRDYGRSGEDEYMQNGEYAEYEDISSYANGSIADFME